MSAAVIEMLESAAAALGPLVDGDVVFVGGATIALWNTDQATSDFRPTDDVDVIVEVASRSEYYRFEDRLRELGFVNDQGRVICRFRHPAEDLILDVMPTEATILGFENQWQKKSFPHAHPSDLRPPLHVDHAFLPARPLRSSRGSAPPRTLSPPSAEGQFSTGERGSVFRRRLHRGGQIDRGSTLRILQLRPGDAV